MILEELNLIQCSLLPDEHLTFLDEPELWNEALSKYAEDPQDNSAKPISDAYFSIRLDGAKLWFEFTLADMDHHGGPSTGVVSVKGDNISRDEQERWQGIITRILKDLKGSDTQYTIYELISVHILPLLHEDIGRRAIIVPSHSVDEESQASNKEVYHALFTSHHLISPNKRRSLQHWSSSLSITGFAKVGYPGVIYAQGERLSVEEFSDNVKAMQWLALKLRFVEPLPVQHQASNSVGGRSWKEFEKVGEVVEEMRRLGREEYVVEMGIGSAGTK